MAAGVFLAWSVTSALDIAQSLRNLSPVSLAAVTDTHELDVALAVTLAQRITTAVPENTPRFLTEFAIATHPAGAWSLLSPLRCSGGEASLPRSFRMMHPTRDGALAVTLAACAHSPHLAAVTLVLRRTRLFPPAWHLADIQFVEPPG